MARKVAEARRTQMVTTYGVGALFPARDESFMLLGVDDWYPDKCPEVTEPRLARSMGVRTFRMPSSRGAKDLPVIRFPRRFHCPKCHRLGPLRSFCGWDGHECDRCQRQLTPSRFVICCPNGHIDDFPYFAWVHKGVEASEDKEHQLFLRSRGQSSSLADIVISCSCGVPGRSLAGSFGPQAMAGVTSCKGRRPWLRDAPDDSCDQLPRTLQRGASNVWFASVRSAISIPPWSEGAHRTINKYWPMVAHIPAEALAATLTGMRIDKEAGVAVDDLVQAILVMRGDVTQEVPDDDDLRAEEYDALVKGRPEKDPRQQFVCTPVNGLPSSADGLFAGVSEVSRLREVRALQGFTRVTPYTEGEPEGRIAPLSAERPQWLPAVEVLGEGVFFQIAESSLSSWESGDFATSRAQAVEEAYRIRAEAMGVPHTRKVSATRAPAPLPGACAAHRAQPRCGLPGRVTARARLQQGGAGGDPHLHRIGRLRGQPGRLVRAVTGGPGLAPGAVGDPPCAVVFVRPGVHRDRLGRRGRPQPRRLSCLPAATRDEL